MFRACLVHRGISRGRRVVLAGRNRAVETGAEREAKRGREGKLRPACLQPIGVLLPPFILGNLLANESGVQRTWEKIDFPCFLHYTEREKKDFTGSEGETLESSSPHIRSLDRSSFLLGRRKLVSCVCNLPYRFSPAPRTDIHIPPRL